MNDWPLTCLFIVFGIMTLVAWPIAAIPTLTKRRKIILLSAVIFILTPATIGLYLWWVLG